MSRSVVSVSITRIYQPISLMIGELVSLNEEASHHLASVLRAKIGDKIKIFNGQGGEFEAVITRIAKRKIETEILQFIPRESESPIDIYLAQGIARGEKMDFIIQKAVELGVKKIIPLITERCNVRLDASREAKKVEHWQSIIVSACEQCGRNQLPIIVAPQYVTHWLKEMKMDYVFVLFPHATAKLKVEKILPGASITLLIGPEGGLSEEEIEMAKKAGYQLLNLGPRILRTETASLTAISIFQYNHGDIK